MATATLTANPRVLSRGVRGGVTKTVARPVQVNRNANNYNAKNKISSFVSESEMIDYINEIGEQYYGN